MDLAITRVVNACALLELGGAAVLTDPYFEDHWFMRMREPIGLRVEQLPRLAAILGGHSVFDHWQPASLAAYPHQAETPVLVATRSMRAKALAAGFQQVEVVTWGERRTLAPGLEVEVAPAQTATGLKVNSYVLSASGRRVFVGTEARDLEPLRRYREQQPGVEVAMLPIDGARVLGHKLVMDAQDALEAARILGAHTLVPFHYALEPIPLLLQTPSDAQRLQALAPSCPEVRVVQLAPGQRWVGP
jgi:L-ascorbate metabolism protein UlaG (beta-lactamase superfamily)